ncbi:hypothetical protein [Saccharothrix deserti]|uniref:hypothetical protein n=1 Tax=Saccharothrix deserti TaxID=2593674 RepID=UPI00192E6EE4|nr:hypothetical protein [Saccharothrix deserti]
MGEATPCTCTTTFENVSDPTHLGEGDSDPGNIVARNNFTVGSGPILTAGTGKITG